MRLELLALLVQREQRVLIPPCLDQQDLLVQQEQLVLQVRLVLLVHKAYRELLDQLVLQVLLEIGRAHV